MSVAAGMLCSASAAASSPATPLSLQPSGWRSQPLSHSTPCPARIIQVHHKSGTEMVRAGARAINEVLRHYRHCVVSVDASCTTACAMPDDACVAHVHRNPFEMIVSGYFYHSGDNTVAWDQKWLSEPMMQERILNETDGCVPFEYKRDGALPVPRGVCDGGNTKNALYLGLRDAVLATQLPQFKLALPAKPGESYQQYLRRVDVRSGLLAEYMVTKRTRDAMLAAHSRGTKMGCHTSFDFEQFQTKRLVECQAMWQQLIIALDLPGQLRSRLAHAAAIASCRASTSTDVKRVARRHSGGGNKTEVVDILKELDDHLLGGELQTQAASLREGLVAVPQPEAGSLG